MGRESKGFQQIPEQTKKLITFFKIFLEIKNKIM